MRFLVLFSEKNINTKCINKQVSAMSLVVDIKWKICRLTQRLYWDLDIQAHKGLVIGSVCFCEVWRAPRRGQAQHLECSSAIQSNWFHLILLQSLQVCFFSLGRMIENKTMPLVSNMINKDGMERDMNLRILKAHDYLHCLYFQWIH